MHHIGILMALFSTILSLGCLQSSGSIDSEKDYYEVSALLQARDLNIPCGETISFEGRQIGITGKLGPDYSFYLNDYDPDYPDTWRNHFRVLDRSIDSGESLGTFKAINKNILQVYLYHDGKNASSFHTLVKQLDDLFKDKAWHTVRIKGIARGFDMPSNLSCKKGVYLELRSVEDVEIVPGE